MPSIKIRNLTSATEPEVVSSNFLAAALDENAGLTKSTRKVTFAQVVTGGLKDGVVPIPIGSLPIATTTSLGVVKVGNNLTIDPDGTLNAPAPSGGGGTFYAFSSGIITNKGEHTIFYPAGWAGGTPDNIIVSTRYPAGDALSTVHFQLVSFTSTTVTVFAQAGATTFATHFCDVLLVKN